jgi:xylose isomerase
MKKSFLNVPQIAFEGSNSKTPLAFKHYNAAEIVEG